jgi:multicomponent K+:H+ antiporter subunit D
MLASNHLARLVSYSLVASTGILLAALGLGLEPLTAPVLFYLIVSALTAGTFFMLTGMTDRTRSVPTAATPADPPEPQSPFYTAFGVREPDPYGTDDDVGVAIPRAIVFLGLAFVSCVLLVTGLPPLPGFIAKFALLAALLDADPISAPAWSLLVLLTVSGLAATIATARAGIRIFWASAERSVPRVAVIEMAPIALLLALCAALTVQAGPAMRYLHDTAQALHAPRDYIEEVLAR